jgi:hypothetical protein
MITELKCLCFRIFEKIRQYFGQQGESIPMSFVLGFYVSLIVKRWWEQYRLLPWPDSLALFVSAAIPGVVSTSDRNATAPLFLSTTRTQRRLMGGHASSHLLTSFYLQVKGKAVPVLN